MADVRIRFETESAQRDALIEGMRQADDVVDVRVAGDEAVVQLAGYEQPAAESRVREIADHAATAAGIDRRRLHVQGAGWQVGEDHV